MSTGAVPSRPSSHPSAGGETRPQTRLRWWGLVLPVLAFAVLLMLMPAGGAHATEVAQQAPWQPVVGLMERLGHLLFAG